MAIPITNPCNNRNPLQRGGVSQKDRLLAALGGSYVQFDEQSLADLLVFARRYAGELQYVDLENLLSGDWSPFFQRDVSVLVALITQNEPAAYAARYRQLETQLRQQISTLTDPLPSDLPAALPAFKQLFDYLASLAAHLDGQVAPLPELGLKAYAYGSIRQEGRRAMNRLLGYYKAALDATAQQYVLVDATQRQLIDDLPHLNQVFIQDVVAGGLRGPWLDTNLAWADYFATQLAVSDYLPAYGQPTLPLDSVQKLEQHLLPVLRPLRGVFQALHQLAASLAAQAPVYLEQTLVDWPTHEPHQALFLAFLRLYRFGQQHLNGLRDRHLHYYFEEVLRLQPQPPQPAEVHLLVELAKQVEAHLLAAGARFKAGKDSLGQPVEYTLPTATAFDRTAVSQVSGLYYTAFNGKMYTAAHANSEDGAGAKIEATDGRWKPFGPITRFRGDILSAQPEAPVYTGDDPIQQETFARVNQAQAVGFALASPTLYLREGTRVIELKLTVTSGEALAVPAWTSDNFRLRLTTPEGWHETKPSVSPTLAAGVLTIRVELGPDAPVVGPYVPAVHGRRFATSDPVLEVWVQAVGGGASPYTELQKLVIQGAVVKVTVTGAKQLALYNDQGAVDPSKPFLPFGAVPKVGSRLLVGSPEAFQKKLTGNLTLKLAWDGLDALSNPFQPSEEVDLTDVQVQVPVHCSRLDGSGPSVTVPLMDIADDSITGQSTLSFANGNNGYGRNQPDSTDYSGQWPYTLGAREGFLALRLNHDLGHALYQRELPKALVAMSKETVSTTGLNANFVSGSNIVLPDPPYTPVWKELSLDYEATEHILLDGSGDFAVRSGRFFHVYPLGEREAHPLLRAGEATTLLPTFDQEGELYIGLSGGQPRQLVQLLVQVAEGTAHPLRPLQSVQWAWLDGNYWRPFASDELVDGTAGLLRSGLVAVTLPRKITADNTWLPPGQMWLRASVTQYTDAVCDLLMVAAQAMTVRFADRPNAADLLATPLAAGAISKLVQPDAAVKKINQPFASFGGRPAEAQPAFVQRVSERLRHKDRAITIWDYEHLVLELFPEVYKVKCLNHTRLRPDPLDPNRWYEDEVAPGHVLLVAVADQRHRPAIDPLRPYVSLGTLGLIGDALRRRSTPQAQLDVRNPEFEAVQLEFAVKFRPGNDPVQYTKLLNQAIIEYLSPWAFEREADIAFGGRIHKSAVLDFVEELPYVDYVLSFKMHQNPDDPAAALMDVEEALPQTGRSILVSHRKHLICEAEGCTVQCAAASAAGPAPPPAGIPTPPATAPGGGFAPPGGIRPSLPDWVFGAVVGRPVVFQPPGIRFPRP